MATEQSFKTSQSTSVGRVVLVLQFALIGLAIFWLSRAALALLAPESLWQAPAAAAPMSANGTAKMNSTELDLSFDPFHRDTPTTVDEIIEIGTDAPETTLNLKLFGRRAGKNGSAILETPDRTQKVFRIGEEIMNGVTLKAVNSEYIVLSQGGRIERLTFERDNENLLSAPKPDTNQISATMTAVPESLTIESFMSGVSLSPELRNGKLAGFRLTPKSSQVNLASINLQSGDVVASIGDIDLTSPTLNPADIPAQLSGRSNVRLKVIRGAQTVYVTLGK